MGLSFLRVRPFRGPSRKNKPVRAFVPSVRMGHLFCNPRPLEGGTFEGGGKGAAW